jgi:hypothetical protein
VQKTKSKYPKRIRQVSSKGEVDELPEDVEDGVSKAASARDLRAEADCEDSANEFLLLITDQLAVEKRATVSLTSELLNRVAKDGLSGTLSTYRDGGLGALVESLKGAADTPVSLGAKSAAAALICKSARLAPIARTFAAAEFQDLAPAMYGAALAQGPDMMEKLAGVASLFNMAYFRPTMLDKRAATNPALLQELELALDKPDVMLPEADEMEDALTSDVGGALSDETEGGESATEEENPLENEDEVRPESDDLVDEFMELDSKSPMLTPLPEAAPMAAPLEIPG